MHINILLELTMVLESKKFHKILSWTDGRADYLIEKGNEIIDQYLTEKGITVIYRDSQYKKKVKLVINPKLLIKSDVDDTEVLVKKMEKCITEYFNFKYRIDDFTLSGMILSADIDVGDQVNVLAYLKVLQRIGKVKGFSPVNYDCFRDNTSFCLEGNSNGIKFMIYDLESLLVDQMEKAGAKRKKVNSMSADVEGILRAEVHLEKSKAIRNITKETDIERQIEVLSERRKDIFMNIFTQVIPYGDFYKKEKAAEIVRQEINSDVVKRKMLRLLALIPEKRSLYLAQKAMNCRNIEKVMDAFAKINVSPVTISKRHNVIYLKDIYTYFR